MAKISTASIFEDKEFKEYPFLQDGVTTDSYEIKQMSDYQYCNVMYDTLHNFFILEDGSSFQIIDAKGKVVNSQNNTNKDAEAILEFAGSDRTNLVYLRDYENKRYSYYGGWSELKEHEKIYKSDDKPGATINTMFFRKEWVHETINTGLFSTPFPRSFKGTGYFQLEKGNQVLKFKNTMLKSALSQKEYATVYHLVIPERFRNKTEVSFIMFKPVSNYADGAGTYMVKRKD
ncbi:hypothetical protein QSV08_09895 [Maribacter sp. BPC-D8]|uniref:hypothetical protein n=1 Tax=Maribacter sp. BPC-D8 TaxID=3053613 RepID=UPI002B4883BD|nr:hypothetical protein [Maribacter sp. BPC-D8]WRI31548.1 hypothetical protein QSV08_09895 [Maribacter sp. BPC-D8]